MAESQGRELWQCALDRMGAHVNLAVLHPLDEERLIRQLQSLYSIGERPSYERFKRYLAEIWAAWPSAQRRVRSIWKIILRDPYHRFRKARRGPPSFLFLRRVANEEGLTPLEDRVEEVLAEAAAAYSEIAWSSPEVEEFLAARRELLRAIQTVRAVREARLGPGSTGNWIDMSPEDYSAAEAQEWTRLRKRYARSGIHWSW
jgi:hypothetical protein